MKYLFSNVLGCFIFDNQFNLIEEVKFIKTEDYFKKNKLEPELNKKYPDLVSVPPEKLSSILSFFKDSKFYSLFYQKNLELTKQKIKSSVSDDTLIIQTISNIEEVNKLGNILAKRLREWYSWYFPEFSESIGDNEKFTELIVFRTKSELLRELNLRDKESMGADLKEEDVKEIVLLGKEVLQLYQLKQKHEEYLKVLMARHCPNLLELAGVTIGAKLLEFSKGLKHLATLPASTIQLLGAEKALFRHLKIGSRSPKHGLIVNHPFIQKVRKEDKGKASRSLADKLSFCARLDFFKGEF